MSPVPVLSLLSESKCAGRTREARAPRNGHGRGPRGLPSPRLVSLSPEVEGSVREQGGRNTWRWRSGKTEFEFLLSSY